MSGRCGLVGESVSLQKGFGVSKTQARPSVSLLLPVVLDAELSPPSPPTIPLYGAMLLTMLIID